jgi:hypothetical protein
MFPSMMGRHSSSEILSSQYTLFFF